MFLAGYEGSKRIIPASSWLVAKYIPEGFEVAWLNYGAYQGKLFRGSYVKLAEEQEGGKDSWCHYLSSYLTTVPDEYIILALDDYLLNAPLDMGLYSGIFARLDLFGCAAARLCDSSFYDGLDSTIDENFFTLAAESDYTVTTQWTIWRRKDLVKILGHCTSAWDFEVRGSGYYNGRGMKTLCSRRPALDYQLNSALSPRYGDKVLGRGIRDLEELIAAGLLAGEEICWIPT